MSWLSEVGAGGDEVLVHGHPAADCADLRIGPDRVVLATASASSELSWTDHAAPDGWSVTYLKEERPVARGAGVAVTGSYVERTGAVWRSTRSWRNGVKRATAWFATSSTPRVVPLTNIGRHLPEVVAARDTIEALCQLLATRPPLRDRLRQPNVANDLAAGIRDGAVPRPAAPLFGVRRATTETLSAMRALRLEHPLMGRPLPGEPIVALDDATDRVMTHLTRSPYAGEVELDRRQVAELVGRHYAEIEPWPFAALTDPS